MILTLKICSYQIQKTRGAEFTEKRLKVLGMKKKHMFLFHYGKQQIGGRGPRTNALPLNVLKLFYKFQSA